MADSQPLPGSADGVEANEPLARCSFAPRPACLRHSPGLQLLGDRCAADLY